MAECDIHISSGTSTLGAVLYSLCVACQQFAYWLCAFRHGVHLPSSIAMRWALFKLLSSRIYGRLLAGILLAWNKEGVEPESY